MLYMTTEHGQKLVILETQNLEELKKGHPAITPDSSVIVSWTPDPVWLADKIMEAGSDAAMVAKLIDECSKREQKPPRPYHKPHHWRANDSN